MGVANIYGAKRSQADAVLQLIYDETKEGDNVNYSAISLSPSSSYIIVRTAWTISTGRIYGHGMHHVSTPDAEAFGTVAATNTAFAASSNSGITISFPATGTIQWRCSGAAYRVRVRVYKIN